MAAILESWTVYPHEALVEIDERLLTVAGYIPMPLGNFPRRMTVVGLAGNRTAIFSAIALDEAGMARIEALGRPAFLVVPSDHHRLDARIWKQRYPDIEVVAPAGARHAVEEVVPVDTTADPFGDPDVHLDVVAGTDGHEAALIVKRPAGTTLILNDIIAHVAHPHGLGAHIVARLFGFGVKEPQVPRPIASKVVTDKAALAAQMRRWAALPGLKRIIVSHGDVIDRDPAGVLETVAEGLEG